MLRKRHWICEGSTTSSRGLRGRYHRLCQDPGGGDRTPGGGGVKKRVRFCTSVSVVRPPPLKHGLGGLEALAIRERYGEGAGCLYASVPTASLALRRQHARAEEPLRVKMLSYVLPVEEKVGLREEDDERSPGSETRPLLSATTDGPGLAALQHALSHAAPPADKPPTTATAKPSLKR
ncbi:hypothetical protein O3P69_019513 [Scylla paramamosain]|uniref:Uncharacterized protein n=1 Tax=Scylla paramamosain TaxID=85552 RepID=A0AAW0SY43_SCYPA